MIELNNWCGGWGTDVLLAGCMSYEHVNSKIDLIENPKGLGFIEQRLLIIYLYPLFKIWSDR